MFANITNPLSFEVKRLERAIRVASKDFNALQANIKKGSPILEAKRAADTDLQRFNEDNRGVLDHTIVEKHDHNWAKYLLYGTFLFESVLSYKGTQYFFEHFTGVSSWWVIIPVALFIAYFAIMMSIHLNHFAKKHKEENSSIYNFLLAGSYLLILIIPAANILEGFEANDSGDILLLNLFIVLVTVSLHAWLITMSKIFIDSEVAHKAAKIRIQKITAAETVGKKLETFSLKEFTPTRDKFAESAKNVVALFSRLREKNADAARLAMTRCDNFLIWALNNVMMHSIIPFHADANGSIQLPAEPFTAEQQSIADGWAGFSTVTFYRTNFGNNGVQSDRTVGGGGKQLNEDPFTEPQEKHGSQTETSTEGFEADDQFQQEESGPNHADKWL